MKFIFICGRIVWYMLDVQADVFTAAASGINRKGVFMAKDMLDAVCAAEEEAAKREEKATEQAAESAEKAKQDAAALINERKTAAEQKSKQEIDKAKAEFDKKSLEAKADAQKQCEEISALADKNRGAVIKKAAEMLVK